MLGRTLGRYRIEEELGSGGMGIVYRATDLLLKRPVAVKLLAKAELLDSELATRFLNEARTASSLAHPNVCTIHDFGELEGRPYLVMEFLAGKTLRERSRDFPVQPDQAVEWALRIASGLEAAHQHGIVHRDIKPANVFINEDGEVKIVDFGLAKKAVLEEAPSGDTGTQLTRDGTALLGTVDYMSPEQALGQPLDGRSDLFSLGILCYEMLTGEHPFRSRTVVATLDSVINKSPRPSGRYEAIPPQLRRILDRLLEKDPERRYAAAGELIHDLERFQQGRSGPVLAEVAGRIRPAFRPWAWAALLALLALIGWGAWEWASEGSLSSLPGTQEASASAPTVGVLPLVNLSADPGISRVGLGISHTLISSLSNLRSVSMISPSATLGLSSQEAADTAAVARELGAEYLVTGSVQQASQRLLVTLHLLKRNSVVWGGETQGNVEDLFELQHRLAEQLAEALQLALSEDDIERLQRRPTLDNEAFAEYLQARAFLERPDVEGNRQRAVELFRAALERDGSFALAHAGLGDAYWSMYEKTGDPSWTEKARQSIQRAIEIDPQRPEVRVSMAVVYQGSGENAKAIDELRRALRLQPNQDDAHRLLGNVLSSEGKLDEALQAYGRAIRLRPDYWGNHRALGLAYFNAGRYREAIGAFKRVTELQPDSAWGYQSAGVAYHALGDLDDAISWYTRALAEGPSAAAHSNLGTIHYRRGEYRRAADNYEQALQLSPRRVATLRNLGDAYQRLGQPEKAADAYQDAVAIVHEDLQVNPKDARQLGLLALLEAKLGRFRQASRKVEQALELAPDDSQVVYREAVVQALCGHPQEALRALEKALDLGYSRSEARLDDDLASVRGLPAFQQILHDPQPNQEVP